MKRLEKSLKIYQSPSGDEPFTDWLKSVKDKNNRIRIINRLDRIMQGNLGDYKSLGDDAYELRLLLEQDIESIMENWTMSLSCYFVEATKVLKVEIL